MPETNKYNILGSWFIGTFLLLFLIWVFLFAPDVLPPYKYKMLGIFCALLSGLFAFFFTGTISVNYKINGLAVKAAGGFGIFIAVMAFWLSPAAPIKDYEKQLEKQQQEIAMLLEQEPDARKREALEKIATLLDTKSKNADNDFNDRAVKLLGVSMALENFENVLTPSRYKQVNKAIKKGDLVTTESILSKVIEDNTEHSPEAAYLIGVLREAGLDFVRAGQFYREAFWRASDILKYRTAVLPYFPLNELLVYAAWKNYESGKFDITLQVVNECITELSQTALQIQQALQADNEEIPALGKIADNAAKNRIFSRGVLNDVASCWFVKARTLEKLDRITEAVVAYCETEKYTFARTYDPGFDGFWSPAQSASDRRVSLAGMCN